MSKYFGTDGFRGEANEGLTVEHAYRIGRFLGWYYGREHKCSVVIGKDTRRSSYMFENALSAGLTAAGLDTFASIPFFTGYTLANLPIVLFIYIGVTGIGFTCYFLSMEVTSAQTTSLVFFFKPALAPLLAFLVLHEAIPGNMLAGIACILCGSLVSILPGLLAQRKSALPVTEGATREKIEV